MNKQANIFFIPESSSSKAGRLSAPSYHLQLIYTSLNLEIITQKGFESIGRQLAAIARHAYLTRQVEVVEQASQMMLALPISGDLEIVALHYQALCAKQEGKVESARKSFERIAEATSPQYRARSLQCLGATYFEQGELDSALPLYTAAGKAASRCDLSTSIESQRMIAVIRSIHGDHKRALADLESLFPMVHAIAKHYPTLYYDYLNSLAVELGAVGRLEEANSALSIALASPYALAYPEWSETRQDLEAKRAASTPAVAAVKIKPQPEPKRQRLVAFNWPARKELKFQTAIKVIAARAAIIPLETTNLIQTRVLKCARTRSPPLPNRA